MLLNGKVDVPPEHFDRLASPVASLVVVTTVDEDGRVNAAPVWLLSPDNQHHHADLLRIYDGFAQAHIQ